MAELNVWKSSGELLFDTDLICYGLVKSGYMAYLQSWSRRALRSEQLDPNNGANWFETSVTVNASHTTDALYGFTVTNAICPIVFITGPGCLNGSFRSGNSITYYYANATTATKYYCFDLMADTIPGEAYLKTWSLAGDITFNSLQPPLNVVAAVQAPGPGLPQPDFGLQTCYTGGYNTSLNSGTYGEHNKNRLLSRVDINITAGAEYAAYLPWSRTVAINDFYDFNGLSLYEGYGGSEGAYGRVGGITFMFGPAAATTSGLPNSGRMVAGTHAIFANLPTDRYPIALAVKTASLPFPFN